MKNKTFKVGGFIIGATLFLFLFMWLAIPNISPENENISVAGMTAIVLSTAVLMGCLTAFLTLRVKNYLVGKDLRYNA